MVKEGLVSSEAGEEDARQKLIRLTRQGRALLPRLQVFWQATSTAARSLDAELETSLVQTVEAAIQALQAKPFGERIREARTAARRKTTGTRRPHAATS
jgi:DNA-binding MarR family transcriptional regulator